MGNTTESCQTPKRQSFVARAARRMSTPNLRMLQLAVVGMLASDVLASVEFAEYAIVL
jgi:hypothetical protein